MAQHMPVLYSRDNEVWCTELQGVFAYLLVFPTTRHEG